MVIHFQLIPQHMRIFHFSFFYWFLSSTHTRQGKGKVCLIQPVRMRQASFRCRQFITHIDSEGESSQGASSKVLVPHARKHDTETKGMDCCISCARPHCWGACSVLQLRRFTCLLQFYFHSCLLSWGGGRGKAHTSSEQGGQAELSHDCLAGERARWGRDVLRAVPDRAPVCSCAGRIGSQGVLPRLRLRFKPMPVGSLLVPGRSPGHGGTASPLQFPALFQLVRGGSERFQPFEIWYLLYGLAYDQYW